jgi:V8-like Glu-specific endopeptidase
MEMISKNFAMISCFIFSISTFNNLSFAEKVIYGEDNRQDLKDISNPDHINWARATAAMIDTKSLVVNQDKTFTITYGTLKKEIRACPEVKFAEQIAAADCSGFLVAKDLLVTAGHCVRNIRDCKNKKWVFDYSIKNTKSNPAYVLAKNIYQCQEIISHVEDRFNYNDYTLIRLNRVVSDRRPLAFRSDGKIKYATDVVLIGHPSGLPTKVSAGAYVTKNNKENYFTSNVDSFGGNSGSPIINAQSGEVEGILVRGSEDYEMDFERKCRVPKVCLMKGCQGEDAIRITNLSKIILNSIQE